MKKVSALDFLNKATFSVDIYSESGVVLFPVGTKIMPDTLLRAYFKDLYIKEEDEEKLFAESEETLKEKEKLHENKEQEVETLLSKAEDSTTAAVKSVEEVIEKEEPVEEEPVEEKPLEFDEQIASQVSELSVKFATSIGYNPNEIDEIKKAAYYKNIGIKFFKNTDVKKSDFKDKVREKSYNIMKDEMKFPENIAEVARLYNIKYDVKNFTLNPEEHIPNYYLIGIVDFYINLLEKMPREDVLEKMLKIGGNKFNLFLLHKFINMMRETNGRP